MFHRTAKTVSKSMPLLAIGLAMGMLSSYRVHAGTGLIQSGAVGGVKIDADGVLSNPTSEDLAELQAAWQAGLESIPGELDDPVELRFVSLKALEAEIARHRNQLQPLPNAVTFLAGLQRVRYVLIYPERGDIVIAGPAEGWRIDTLGNVVGATSGRPVLLLDDLMVALRSASTSGQSAISCSIDPTDEGVRRAQQLGREARAGISPEDFAQRMEQALGEQMITVSGIPHTSHFARVLVAADYRMKRLAMGFEAAPVGGLPSYLETVRTGRQRSANLTPRWWLAPHYESLRKDPDGLAWEIRGQGVKCLTEQDMIAADGSRTQTGQTEVAAQQWADAFTEQFEELSREDSSFGSLRNVMDLAVVGALLAKENLLEKVGLELPRMLDEELLAHYNAPRRIASQASFVKRPVGWLVSASGGVHMDPWYTADQLEVSATLVATRTQAAADHGQRWWWNVDD